MPADKRRRDRTPLTRARITEAALAIADTHGVDAVSMRAVAARLGVEAMSLYNHVRNKEDLIDEMVEAVLDGVDPPEAAGDWRAQMRRRARSMRAVFLDHPWAPPLVAGRINVGPNMLGLIDATLGCLRAAGFTYAQADHVWNAVDSHVYGYHLLEQVFPLHPEHYAAAARAFLPHIPVETYPHMHALSVKVAEGEHAGTHDFTFGLDLLLDALERWRVEGAMAER